MLNIRKDTHMTIMGEVSLRMKLRERRQERTLLTEGTVRAKEGSEGRRVSLGSWAACGVTSH